MDGKPYSTLLYCQLVIISVDVLFLPDMQPVGTYAHPLSSMPWSFGGETGKNSL